MKKTNKLINAYQDFVFSSGGVIGDDFKTFARQYRAAIKEQLGEKGVIVKWNLNHYYVSGFIRHVETGKLIYFSIGDVRWSDDWLTNILIRTAEHDKDYKGGFNQYTPLIAFHQAFERLVE